MRSACFGTLLILAGCGRAEPPTITGLDAAVAPLPPPSAAAAASAGAAPPPLATHVAKAQADAGSDPDTLAQTRDKPSAKSAAFDARAEAVFRGIVEDDPDRAMPAFFPVTAYEQVKAVGNPAADWRLRLVAAYKRDIHALHRRLGERASGAKLLRADVPEDRAKWVEPDEEYNKLGYWRVYGTRLVYELDGKERSFEVTSLISWRGEWYVVHLTGFK